MNPSTAKIRVLIVDDSAVIRNELTALLNRDEHLEVVGTAIDPYVARDKILKLEPDVLLLDFGLPRMDGLAFLRTLMEHHPMPIIILSGLARPGSKLAIDALEAGAIDVFEKRDGDHSIAGLDQELIRRIYEAARYAPEMAAKRSAPTQARPKTSPAVAGAVKSAAREPLVSSTGAYDPSQVLLIGASTGGTEAIRDVLTRLPDHLPGIAIVQHIPPVFSKSFAERLNSLCAFEVREARDGDELPPGLALVAPGDFHMVLQIAGGKYRVRLHRGEKQHHQRPAVDVLFASAAACAGANAVGVILTGMGRDGALGLKELQATGAPTLAQDEASCVVFGMPRAAQELGAADHVVSLTNMPQQIIRSLSKVRTRLQAGPKEQPALVRGGGMTPA